MSGRERTGANKATSLRHFLSKVRERFVEGSFELVDHWDSDLNAIGFTSANQPERLVYISTFGCEPGTVAFHCEEGDGTSEAVGSLEMAESASEEAALDVIEHHLGLRRRR